MKVLPWLGLCSAALPVLLLLWQRDRQAPPPVLIHGAEAGRADTASTPRAVAVSDPEGAAAIHRDATPLSETQRTESGDDVALRADQESGSRATGSRLTAVNSRRSVASTELRTPEALARAALRLIGRDATAEKTWVRAINDSQMPADDRHDLIEDLADEGFPDSDRPTAADLPMILARLALIERLRPYAMDKINADAFDEAYKDLLEMYVQVADGKQEK